MSLKGTTMKLEMLITKSMWFSFQIYLVMEFLPCIGEPLIRNSTHNLIRWRQCVLWTWYMWPPSILPSKHAAIGEFLLLDTSLHEPAAASLQTHILNSILRVQFPLRMFLKCSDLPSLRSATCCYGQWLTCTTTFVITLNFTHLMPQGAFLIDYIKP